MYRGSVGSHLGHANKQTFNVITTPFHCRGVTGYNCDEILANLPRWFE